MNHVEDMEGYKLTQVACQRYLGPPIWYKGEEPPHMTEIFLSNLGRNVNETEVFKLCSPFGWIYQIRLPVTFSDAKGFAYCRFTTKASATNAISSLNETTFHGKTIKVALSFDARIIQIMDLPNSLSELALKDLLMHQLKNVKTIKIFKEHNFALCTFVSHNDAQTNIRELKKILEFSNVQWARGDYDLPEEVFQTRTDLYVGHLPEYCTIAELRAAISTVINPTKVVIKINKLCFGFLYFVTHDEAEMAFLCLRARHVKIRGQAITFNWLKGEFSKKRSARNTTHVQAAHPLQNQQVADLPRMERPPPPIERWSDEVDGRKSFGSFNRAPGAELCALRRLTPPFGSPDSGLGPLFSSQ